MTKVDRNKSGLSPAHTETCPSTRDPADLPPTADLRWTGHGMQSPSAHRRWSCPSANGLLFARCGSWRHAAWWLPLCSSRGDTPLSWHSMYEREDLRTAGMRRGRDCLSNADATYSTRPQDSHISISYHVCVMFYCDAPSDFHLWTRPDSFVSSLRTWFTFQNEEEIDTTHSITLTLTT